MENVENRQLANQNNKFLIKKKYIFILFKNMCFIITRVD